MRLIVGLGNPGARYDLTRHNVGAAVLGLAATRWRVALTPLGDALRGSGSLGPVEVTLAAPVAWMNQSGPVVKALLAELALTPGDLLVVHDDLDLEVGRLRIKRDGGSGGHQGILSVITALGTNQFCRLKIGIGRPSPGTDAAEYVLSTFFPDETPLLQASLERAPLALECLLLDGLDAAMTRFNVWHEEAQG
ncbi:MAG: aminoacyl-tRNA hydrolase [Nitrospirota bacterium]|nr:aminoacyl-tRNA hydrolase [Nitrospirota bacterium]